MCIEFLDVLASLQPWLIDVFPVVLQKYKFVVFIWKMDALEKYWGMGLRSLLLVTVSRLDIHLILATYSKLKSGTKQSGWVSPAGVTDEAGGE